MLLKKLCTLFKSDESTQAEAQSAKNELSIKQSATTPVDGSKSFELSSVSEPEISEDVMKLMRARLEEDKEFRESNPSMDPMEMKDRAATLLTDGWRICDEHLVLLLDDFGNDTEIARKCLEISLHNGGITQNQYMKALVILRQKATNPFPRDLFLR